MSEITDEFLDEKITEDFLVQIGARETDHKPDYRKSQWCRHFGMYIRGHRYINFYCWHYGRGSLSVMDCVVINTTTLHGGSEKFRWDEIDTKRRLFLLLELLCPDVTKEEWLSHGASRDEACSR